MTSLWIDASHGVAGDMLLGALVSAGVELEVIQAAIDPLDVGITFEAEEVHRGALGAIKVHVHVADPQTLRHLPEILELLSALPAPLAERAGAVFTRLAVAEAAVHRAPIESVHFHEVGALDCIADIVGVLAGLDVLGATDVTASPVSLGSGTAWTEHGRIPVPVPAVVELLKGVPTQAGPASFESTTPTGAALLAEVADAWGQMPAMSIEHVGTGAGSKDDPAFPNVVRVIVGTASRQSAGGDAADADDAGEMLQVETNVDDLDPRVWPHAIDAVLDAGAVDAWVTPIVMKKGRPAFTFSALCSPADAPAVRAAIFEQTSTIGLRERAVTRHVLERTFARVEVDGQSIRVKVAHRGDEILNRSVEWDDVVAAADALGRSSHEMLAAATELAQGVAL